MLLTTQGRKEPKTKIFHVTPDICQMFFFVFPPHLELQLHAGDVLPALHLGQLLHVWVQTPGGHLGVPAGHGLQQGLVDEAVLVLRLHHVVPLWAHQGHMTVDVHGALVSNAFQHGVDDDEAASTTNTGTGREMEKK